MEGIEKKLGSFYTAMSLEDMENYIKECREASSIGYPKYYYTHPESARLEAKRLESTEEDLIVFNLQVLDYLPINRVVFVDERRVAHPFGIYFRRKLEKLSPSQIMLQGIKML